MSEPQVLPGRVGYELKRVQHALRGRMDPELRRFGLTTPQYAALSVLSEFPGISGAELARRSFVTAQTMNQILSKLEAAKLIEKRQHPEHGRVLQTFLTLEGERLLNDAHVIVEGIEETMLSSLGEADRTSLMGMLRSCASALENEVE